MRSRLAWMLPVLAAGACDENVASAPQAATAWAYYYDIQLEDLEHQPLNDHGGNVVRFSDLPGPRRAVAGSEPTNIWISDEKRWDHTHAYLAVSVYEPGRGTFSTPPTAYDDGRENYFATYAWNEALGRYAGARVDPEPWGAKKYSNPRPIEPFALKSILVDNNAADRLMISVTADTRTDQSNREALRPHQADNVCYIRKRNERAAKVGPSSNDLPALDDQGGACGPIWSLRTGAGGFVPRRFGISPNAGCDGYVAAHDFVLDGADLARRTDATGETVLEVEQGPFAARGCFTWNIGTGPTSTPSGPENLGTKTKIRVRIRRVGEWWPSFEPTPPPSLDCTLRPMTRVNTPSRRRWWFIWSLEDGRVNIPPPMRSWFSLWRTEDGRVDAQLYAAPSNQPDLLSGTAREPRFPLAAEGGPAAPELMDLPVYAAEIWQDPGESHSWAGGATRPIAGQCKRFVNLPDPIEAADYDLREKALALRLSNQALLALYGEYGPDETFLRARARYLRQNQFGYWIEDRMLFPYVRIY